MSETNVTENEVTYGEDEVLCKLMKDGDNVVLVDCESGEISEPLKISGDGCSYVLPKNRANRKWFAVKKADEVFAETDEIPLTYKATKHFGSIGNRIPNEKLISYLSEDLQEEYKAIIARAIEARNNSKAKPMTELEKAQAKLAKAQAALDKLMAEAAE